MRHQQSTPQYSAHQSQKQQQQAQQQQKQQQHQKQTTLIFSDSTCRNIKTRALNQLIDTSKERVIVSQHPGATIEQLNYYVGYHLHKQKIDRLIIVAGINDLLYASNKSTPITNEHKIVDIIIYMASEAKRFGVEEVIISSLFKVKNVDDKNIYLYNKILQTRCDELGFGYIFNSNILPCDLYDGLHVDNTTGHGKLKHNLMQCMDTYKYGN